MKGTGRGPAFFCLFGVAFWVGGERGEGRWIGCLTEGVLSPLATSRRLLTRFIMDVVWSIKSWAWRTSTSALSLTRSLNFAFSSVARLVKEEGSQLSMVETHDARSVNLALTPCPLAVVSDIAGASNKRKEYNADCRSRQ